MKIGKIDKINFRDSILHFAYLITKYVKQKIKTVDSHKFPRIRISAIQEPIRQLDTYFHFMIITLAKQKLKLSAEYRLILVM